MTSSPHRGARLDTHAVAATRRRGATGWARATVPGSVATSRSRTPAGPDHGGAPAAPAADEVWDCHLKATYALACALLGDEESAAGAVRSAITDLAAAPAWVSPTEARPVMARLVYARSQEVLRDTSRSTRVPRVPPAMVRLGQLAQLQRTCLALCVFGGLSHREVAALLDLPPLTVALSLTSGLKELGHLNAREGSNGG